MSITSFDELFQQSTNFDQLTKTLKGKKKDYSDDRFWKPTKDKAGNAQAVIRFLPVAKGDDLPFVETYTHAFQGPGGQWYIENCPSTIGKPCPVCEANQALWNSGIDSNKDVARKRKRVQKFIANILVLKDSGNPANEGKVFLFKFGNQIMSKITDAADPKFEGDTKINAFHFKEGANFKLRITKKDKYDNYDSSVFDSQSFLFNGEVEKLKEVWESQYSLKEFTAPEEYKSYDELKTKLTKVLGGKAQAASTIEEEIEGEQIPFAESVETVSGIQSTGETLEGVDLDSLSDDMDTFKSLLE